MTSLLTNPAVLLILSGFLIGANFPLGKIASDAGVSPILWPLLISTGGALAMVGLLGSRQALALPSRKTLRFAMISGFISFFAVNLLVFSLIPFVGSGYAGIMFATSPVFTLALAIGFQMKAPNAIGIAGIFIGFIGACLVAYSRQGGTEPAGLIWLVLAFLIPTTLAIGNIYRTVAWPEGASPDQLSLWTNVCASLLYVIALLVVERTIPVGQLAGAPWAAVIQLIVGGLTFPVYFRLQKYGGPILLSQLGYVAAAVGMAAATLFLGERYPALTWFGAVVIFVGIGLSIKAQMSADRT